MPKDYYKILGITKSANKEDIKTAFRKLAHKYHPDKKGGNEQRFKEASEAYSVLSDEKKRAEYDAYGRVFNEEAQSGTGPRGFGGHAGFDFQDFDLGDIFDGFSDIFGGATSRTPRGRDISIDIEISFRDALFGITRKVLITKTSTCELCKGSGGKEGGTLETCSICNGKGKVHEIKRSLIGTFTSVKACESCHGKGQTPKEKCEACHGQGVLRKEKEISITIPPGINNGEMIRLSRAGEAIAGGTPGDLYVKIHVQSDPTFTKEGTNLVTTHTIKLSDALLGTDHIISTLDGNISIKIPAGIAFGEILRVRGKGVPIDQRHRGDLLIKISITLPKKLSGKTKKIVGELRAEGI